MPHKKVRTVFQPSREMENRLSSAAGRSCRLATHKKVRTVFQPSREMENRLSSAAGRSCRLATQDDVVNYCWRGRYKRTKGAISKAHCAILVSGFPTNRTLWDW